MFHETRFRVPRRAPGSTPSPAKEFRGYFFAFIAAALLILAAIIFGGCGGIREQVSAVARDEVIGICASYRAFGCDPNDPNEPEACDGPLPENLAGALSCAEDLDAALCAEPKPGFERLCRVLGANLAATKAKAGKKP